MKCDVVRDDVVICDLLRETCIHCTYFIDLQYFEYVLSGVFLVWIQIEIHFESTLRSTLRILAHSECIEYIERTDCQIMECRTWR